MKNWYKNLKDRYASFSADDQIGHMVSDLNKAKCLQEGNPGSAKNHLYRALILLDYIIADPKWRAKRGELLRLRESIGSLIVNNHPYGNIEQVMMAAYLMDAAVYRQFVQNRVKTEH
ncbi:hypothetical protein JW824_00460 [bacterium]|nr:hypothetical protein [bacterium]RQV99120.1 MAG: hypothetical protein EH221_00625 [bacterium]